MNEYVVASFPFVGDVTTLVIWLLLVIILLIGGVVLLVFRIAALQQRVDVLESRLDQERTVNILDITLNEDDDCRPITLVQHRSDSGPLNASNEAY